MLEHESELLVIDTQDQASRDSIYTFLYDPVVGKGLRSWPSSTYYLLVKTSHWNKFDVLGWRTIKKKKHPENNHTISLIP